MSVDERATILSEIKRLASEFGRSPGVGTFTKLSGIGTHRWSGVYWSKWSDALLEAGLSPNTYTQKLDSDALLERLAGETRALGRVPTKPEMKMIRGRDRTFPHYDVYQNHFGGRSGMVKALTNFCRERENWNDLLSLLPSNEQGVSVDVSAVLGHVYLLRSGEYYKIGRTGTLERRFKEISITLPSAVDLEHTIQTDDPSGIEAYWHRRFSDRRVNGEWFKLTRQDVAAFRRRKFQ